MADLWHYTSEGRQMDPVLTLEIRRLAAAGSLRVTDVVWREGMPAWMPAGDVPEVFAFPAVALANGGGARDRAGSEAPSERRRWDGEGEPDISRRRPRAARQKQLIVLSVGLVAGGALLLLVFVLALFFFAFSAL
jgi:hypothetical protein